MRLEDGNHAPRIVGRVVIPNPNYLQAQLLWDRLAQAGVSQVIISPGSRSTPLARTAAQHEQLTTYVLTDERVAGFFALGLAKGLQKPVALVCTSGTAAAHYYPAIIEAAQSGYSIVVVSADRPKRLRHRGAAQTIDQTALFGRYPRMSLDLPEASADTAAMRGMLDWLNVAIDAMLTPPLGPIHVNIPIDEPLAPIEQEVEACAAAYRELSADIQWQPKALAQSSEPASSVLAQLEASMCGLIVCGPDAARTDNEREAIYGLARQVGWPLLSDVASGLRFSGEPNLPFYDLFIRHPELARLAPDFVIEFGGPPTSRALSSYLNSHRARTLRIQRDSLPRDPDSRATSTIATGVATYCHALAANVKVSRDSLLLDPFWRAAGQLRAQIPALRRHSLAELAYVSAALETLPDDSNLVLASSMPIRYADMVAAPNGKRITVFAQRGTNGIDGTMAHAAGIAQATNRPTLLICGDLAFLHDLGGWMAARTQKMLRVLLLNNNGGGIFHFLPVAEHTDTFERLHGTPIDAQLSAAAALFGFEWHTCVAPTDVDVHLNWSGQSAAVVEVKTERYTNRTMHEEIVTQLLRTLV